MKITTGHDTNNDGENDIFIHHEIKDEDLVDVFRICVLSLLGFLFVPIAIYLLLWFLTYSYWFVLEFGWARIAVFSTLIVLSPTLFIAARKGLRRAKEKAQEKKARAQENEKRRVAEIQQMFFEQERQEKRFAKRRKYLEMDGPYQIYLDCIALREDLNLVLSRFFGLEIDEIESVAAKVQKGKPLATGSKTQMKNLFTDLDFEGLPASMK